MARTQLTTKSVTIASGQSLSDAAYVHRKCLVGIIMPAAWTAASLTFQVSDDGTTYRDFYSTSGEYSASAGVDRQIILSPNDWAGAQHVKVRSGTAGAPVNQGAQRVLKLVL